MVDTHASCKNGLNAPSSERTCPQKTDSETRESSDLGPLNMRDMYTNTRTVAKISRESIPKQATEEVCTCIDYTRRDEGRRREIFQSLVVLEKPSTGGEDI